MKRWRRILKTFLLFTIPILLLVGLIWTWLYVTATDDELNSLMSELRDDPPHAAIQYLEDIHIFKPLEKRSRREIIEDFVAIGPEAEPSLMEIIKNHPSQLAVWGLMQVADGRSVTEEQNPDKRAVNILILAMLREKRFLHLFEKCLLDPSPQVRAAAADAIGILHKPTYDIPFEDYHIYEEEPQISLSGGEKIDIDQFVCVSLYGQNDPTGRCSNDKLADEIIHLPDATRAKLVKVMLEGQTSIEREAAARAIVAWPPDRGKWENRNHILRVAEWGVWIDDMGKLSLAQSIIDEIPPFVHRTGNPLSQLKKRVTQIMMIDKPVIHITSDLPMAIDLEVQIRFGRPWFAYPSPDDFGLDTATQYWVFDKKHKITPNKPVLRGLPKNKSITSLRDVREGYPWLTPSHRAYGARGGSTGASGNDIISVGLRWQSVIVSPKKMQWMKPPTVPDDPKYNWWTRLGEVDCSYVSSRGEAERFLYYDGPTLAMSPVKVKLTDETLSFTRQEIFPESWFKGLDIDDRAEHFGGTWKQPAGLGRFSGMFIKVKDGKVSAWDTHGGGRLKLKPDREITGQQSAEDELLYLLTTMNNNQLSEDEAKGLIDCWSKQFFQTDGKRFILILGKNYCDLICPIKIRPEPDELVRVALVLTEF